MPFIEQGVIPDIKRSRFIWFQDKKLAYDPRALSHAGVAQLVRRGEEFRYSPVLDAGQLLRTDEGNYVFELSADARYLNPDTQQPYEDAQLTNDVLRRLHQTTAVFLTEATDVVWEARL